MVSLPSIMITESIITLMSFIITNLELNLHIFAHSIEPYGQKYVINISYFIFNLSVH
jgi:hypothetical protein